MNQCQEFKYCSDGVLYSYTQYLNMYQESRYCSAGVYRLNKLHLYSYNRLRPYSYNWYMYLYLYPDIRCWIDRICICIINICICILIFNANWMDSISNTLIYVSIDTKSIRILFVSELSTGNRQYNIWSVNCDIRCRPVQNLSIVFSYIYLPISMPMVWLEKSSLQSLQWNGGHQSRLFKGLSKGKQCSKVIRVECGRWSRSVCLSKTGNS